MVKKLPWLDRRIAAAGPYLMLCLHADELHAAMRHCGLHDRPPLTNDGYGGTLHHAKNNKGESVCMVGLAGWEGRDPVEVAGLLVHEAVHVWQQYCADIGEDRPGDEQEAYGVQAIAQELMAEFRRRVAE
jgi:hypothetical protein